MAEKDAWVAVHDAQLDQKIRFLQELIDERKHIHEKHLEQLMQEDCALGTRFLQLVSRQFCLAQDGSVAGNIYSAQSRLSDQRRQMELNLWKEVSQLKQTIEEVREERFKLRENGS